MQVSCDCASERDRRRMRGGVGSMMIYKNDKFRILSCDPRACLATGAMGKPQTKKRVPIVKHENQLPPPVNPHPLPPQIMFLSPSLFLPYFLALFSSHHFLSPFLLKKFPSLPLIFCQGSLSSTLLLSPLCARQSVLSVPSLPLARLPLLPFPLPLPPPPPLPPLPLLPPHSLPFGSSWSTLSPFRSGHFPTTLSDKWRSPTFVASCTSSP